MTRLKKLTTKLLAVSIIGLWFVGCIPATGTGLAIVELGVLGHAENKQAFVNDLKLGYEKYNKEFSQLDCPRREYEISKKIVDFAINHPPNGLDKAILMLKDIYNDETQTDQVRSHALYHVAIAAMRRRDANYSLAENYLTTIKTEFPGSHDCVVGHLMTEINERKKFLEIDIPAE